MQGASRPWQRCLVELVWVCEAREGECGSGERERERDEARWGIRARRRSRKLSELQGRLRRAGSDSAAERRSRWQPRRANSLVAFPLASSRPHGPLSRSTTTLSASLSAPGTRPPAPEPTPEPTLASTSLIAPRSPSSDFRPPTRPHRHPSALLSTLPHGAHPHTTATTTTSARHARPRRQDERRPTGDDDGGPAQQPTSAVLPAPAQ